MVHSFSHKKWFQTMDNKMSYIRVNDIFDELVDENKRLKQSLSAFISYKSFVDFIFDKIRNSLDPKESQKLQDLGKDIEKVFGRSPQDLVPKSIFNSNINIKRVNKNPKREPKSKKIKKVLENNSETNKKVTKTIKPKTEAFEEKIVCDFIGCGLSLSSKECLRRHSKIHRISENNNSFFCDFVGCDYQTNKGQAFRDHLNIHSGLKPYKCEFCQKSFASKSVFAIHRRKVHPLLIKSDKIFICRVKDCKRQFNSRVGLRVHKNSHYITKSFKCDQNNCDFSTDRQYLMEIHLHGKHLKDRHFKCSFEGCHKDYNSPSLLKEHMKRHDPNYKFKCTHEGCQKIFSGSNGLKMHLICDHSNIRFHCEWPGCDYKSGRKASLKFHAVCHSTERNFSCDWPQCGKRFKTKTQLIVHLRIHNNDKRYACSWPGCQYRCTNSGNFVKHRRIHEKKLKV